MLGNGEFLEQEERLLTLDAERAAAYAALTIEEKIEVVEQKEAFEEKIQAMNLQMLRMNSDAPNATLPLNAYANQMRLAILAADYDAFHKLMSINAFRFGKYTPLGMYRFKIIGGKKVYVPFSDVDLANLFVMMSEAENEFGYNPFREPGATCDWNYLLELYVDRQEAAKKQYPNTDWRHVVKIYPGRYICQVYRPSTWVKIRKPVAIAVAIVAAIYLGPIVMSKIGGEGAAAATASAGGEAVTAGIVGAGTKAGVVTAVTTKTAAVAITTTQASAAVATISTLAEAGSLLSKVQTGVDYVNKIRTVDAIIKGELPPPPINISGSSFTEWAMNIAKEEVINTAKEKAAELGMEYIQKELTKEEEAKMRAEILAMQRELESLIPPGTSIYPSPELDADVRAKISQMQDIERQREQQNMVMALIAGGALLMMA